MTKIMVTGASGKLGSAVIKELLKIAPTEQVVAMVRDWAKADELIMKGIEVRYGDYDDPRSLQACLQGIDRLLLISGTDPATRLFQHQQVIDAAKDNKVQFIAYTSVSMKDPTGSELAFLMNSHRDTEAYLQASGIPHSILRNTLYAEDLPYYLGRKERIMQQGVHFPAGYGRIPFVLRAEMAEAFAHLLLMNNPDCRTCEIGNSRAFNFQEITATLSILTGAEILYKGDEPELYAKTVRQLLLPKQIVSFLIHTGADIRQGQYEIVTGDLERLLGRKPTGITDILKNIYSIDINNHAAQ